VIAGLQNPAVLDLGTGSGAIALRSPPGPDAAVIASDVSAAALAVAKPVAAGLGLLNLNFREGRMVRAACGRPLQRHRLESAVCRGWGPRTRCAGK
jgi:methylase of polypeptide subunit release factors